jgi:hypothetical protein
MKSPRVREPDEDYAGSFRIGLADDRTDVAGAAIGVYFWPERTTRTDLTNRRPAVVRWL